MLTATVLIVGAGPVGMWLALELRRAAIDVLVIDTKTSRDDRDRVSKALTVSAGTLDTFHSRGLAPALLERSIRVPRAHFGGLPTTLELNGDVLGVAHPYNLAIPQSRTEAILLAACEKAGVRFAWGLRFARLVQSSRRDVVATAEVVSRTSDADHDPTSSNKAVSITAHWLVGCDGTHSAVRNAVGVPFEGLPHLVTGILADVILTEDPSDGGAPMTIRQGAMGSCIAVKIDGELHRVVGLSKTNRHKPASEELALDEVKDHLRDVFGSDLGAHSPAWMSRFGSACRVAASFRSGRVLLAGDAAHQFFPAGGQGLNLGIQDATNLAWKLVAACREEEEEKAGNSRPETGTSWTNVLAQMSLLMATEPPEMAVRNVVAESLSFPEMNRLWARRMTGFGEPRAPYRDDSNEYDDHELVGARLTHLRVGARGGELYEAIEPSRFVLLLRQDCGAEHHAELRAAADRWADSVHAVLHLTQATDSCWEDVAAVLVRPDLRIAWAGDSASSLLCALQRWFGERS